MRVRNLYLCVLVLSVPIIGWTVLKNQLFHFSLASYSTAMEIDSKIYGSYQVIAIDNKGISSFASEPLEFIPMGAQIVLEAEAFANKADHPYQGFSGEGFVELSITLNTSIDFEITVPKDGYYSIDFRYANGNGPTNTENKCAIRNLAVDKTKAGTIVLPQRGKGEWSNWGFSNSVMVKLKAGKHTVTLSYEPYNENMNGEINQAMLDQLRITSLQ